MDAREKWVKAAEELADQMSFSDSCSLLYSGTKGDNYEVEFMTKRAELFAHLRTTPEGFALVPVPEWVPFDEFTSYPAPESSGWFWYIKDDEIFRGTAMQVCLARGVTYWCPADNPPAPPKAPPPKSESL